jgi:Holliday junction resolvasome RuvABC endonuclease subunit
MILGLDPSIAGFGYAALKLPWSAGPLEVVRAGTWKTKPNASDAKRDDRARRVLELATKLRDVIAELKPELIAIESPVLGMRDGKVAVHVAGRVRGMVEGIVTAMGIGLVEYTPQDVKKHVAGAHDASKAAVADALFARGLKTEKLDDNATDAMAVAYVAAQRCGFSRRLSSATVPAPVDEEDL